jgi:hypothetical protein
VDVAWPTGDQIADIVKDSFAGTAAKTRLTTKPTWPMREVTAALNDLAFRQIFGTRDTVTVHRFLGN